MAGQASAPVALSAQGQPSAEFFRRSRHVNVTADRLDAMLQNGLQADIKELISCCLYLAKCIDCAAKLNEVPEKSWALPGILKQVCRYRHPETSLAAIMVLMISVKDACKLGWFPEKESQELLALAEEIKNDFGILKEAPEGQVTLNEATKIIMTRFYPFWRIIHVYAVVEIKPGYNARAFDFYIPMDTVIRENSRLIVAQTDNIDTSACLITPEKASFLLNGSGIRRRTTYSMDTGPQCPTSVTEMLKYGSNVLQVVGQFTGHYTIVLAGMTPSLPPDPPVLEEYVWSGPVEKDKDSEIIEGPSRVLLNCPISHVRIKYPIKGHLCRHIQCFDYRTYVTINIRKPAWRCPHCNQPVNYADIRIDKYMAKVLKEVGDNVNKVIISEDGSWKAVMENDDQVGKAHDKESDNAETAPVLDLTGDDDTEMDVDVCLEAEDRKCLINDRQGQSNAMGSLLPSNRHSAAQEEEFWSSLYRSLPPPPIINMASPVLTDAVSPALNRGSDVLISNSAVETPILNSLDSPVPTQTGCNQILSQEYPTQASIGLQRTLPIPPRPNIPHLHCSHRPNLLALSHSQWPNSQLRPNSPRLSSTHLLATQRPNNTQSPSSQAPNSQQHAPSGASGQRLSSQSHRSNLSVGVPLNRVHPIQFHKNSSMATNQNRQRSWSAQEIQRMQMLGQLRPSMPFSPRAQVQHVMGHMRRPNAPPPMIVPEAQNMRMDVPVSGVSSADADNPDPNWRPAGRMRGSLIPGAYSSSLDRLIIRPSQETQMGATPSASQPLNSDSQFLSQEYLGGRVPVQSQIPNAAPSRPLGFNESTGSR